MICQNQGIHKIQLKAVDPMSNGKYLIPGESANERSKLQQSGLRSTITYNTTGYITDSLKLNSYHSSKNLRDDDDIISLQEENKMLRNQIEQLKGELRKEKLTQNELVRGFEDEIQKLKNLLEKGYYSIRCLQDEKDALKTQYLTIKINCQALLKKNKTLQELKLNLENTFQEAKHKHEQQIALVWERVAHVQKNLEAVVRIMQGEKEDWKRRKNSGLSASKVYTRKL